MSVTYKVGGLWKLGTRSPSMPFLELVGVGSSHQETVEGRHGAVATFVLQVVLILGNLRDVLRKVSQKKQNNLRMCTRRSSRETAL